MGGSTNVAVSDAVYLRWPKKPSLPGTVPVLLIASVLSVHHAHTAMSAPMMAPHLIPNHASESIERTVLYAVKSAK